MTRHRLDGAAAAARIWVMTSLQKMEARRVQRRECLRLQVLEELRAALRDLQPAEKFILFGSLATGPVCRGLGG